MWKGLYSFMILTAYLVGERDQACKSPQYAELGRNATIFCDFGDSFYGVFWFNTTTVTSSERPFMLITESEKSGRGYRSGEFDIAEDGSLIINNVTLQHDHSFAVNVLYTSDDDPNVENVQVIVFVKPEQPYPVIDSCSSDTICYQVSNTKFTVTCSVEDSRPPASIALVLENSEGEVSLSSNKTISSRGILYTTLINTTITFNKTNRLLLLSCRGGIPSHTPSEAMVLIENIQSEPLSVDDRVDVELGSRLTLNCGKYNASYYVWRRKDQENAIAVGLGSYFGNTSHIYNDEFQLVGYIDTLVISVFEEKHVGTYLCVYGDGITSATKVIDVTVYGSSKENPRPVYLLVVVILLVLLCIIVAVIAFALLRVKANRKKPGAKDTSRHKKEKTPMIRKATDEEIRKFCSSKDIIFEWNESTKKKCSETEHDSMIELLEQASNKKMEVRCVKLQNCFESVDDSTEYIRLASGKGLPVVTSLKRLILHQEKITRVEMPDLEKLLKYATKCDVLDTLQFSGFCMPYIGKENDSLHEILQESKINVEWVSNTQQGLLHIDKKECIWKEKTLGNRLEKIIYDKLVKDMLVRPDDRPEITSALHLDPLLHG